MIEERQYDPEKPISEPGLYAGVPMRRYHGARIDDKVVELCDGISLSSSALRTIFSKSAAHYWDKSIYNPDAELQEETEEMLLGRATHHLLLGESKFAESYAIRPATLLGKPWHANRNDCKEWVADKEYQGLSVLKPDHAERIIGMAEAMAKHPVAQALRGLIERSIVWKDKKTGLWLKMRPDSIVSFDTEDIADYKTISSVDDKTIENAIADRGYFQQGALINEGARIVLGMAQPKFHLIFQESKRPYCIRPVTLSDDDLKRGYRANHAALEKFQRCWKSGIWDGPGYGFDSEIIGIKPWAATSVEGRIAELQMEKAE